MIPESTCLISSLQIDMINLLASRSGLERRKNNEYWKDVERGKKACKLTYDKKNPWCEAKSMICIWNSGPTWLTFMRISYIFLWILSSIKFKLSKEKQMAYMVIYTYSVGATFGDRKYIEILNNQSRNAPLAR